MTTTIFCSRLRVRTWVLVLSQLTYGLTSFPLRYNCFYSTGSTMRFQPRQKGATDVDLSPKHNTAHFSGCVAKVNQNSTIDSNESGLRVFGRAFSRTHVLSLTSPAGSRRIDIGRQAFSSPYNTADWRSRRARRTDVAQVQARQRPETNPSFFPFVAKKKETNAERRESADVEQTSDVHANRRACTANSRAYSTRRLPQEDKRLLWLSVGSAAPRVMQNIPRVVGKPAPRNSPYRRP